MRTLLNSSVRADSIIEPQWIAPERTCSRRSMHGALRPRLTIAPQRPTVLRVPDTEIEDLRPCDVFSFGMTIYAVAERRNPHAGMNAMQMGMKVRGYATRGRSSTRAAVPNNACSQCPPPPRSFARGCGLTCPRTSRRSSSRS